MIIKNNSNNNDNNKNNMIAVGVKEYHSSSSKCISKESVRHKDYGKDGKFVSCIDDET